MAKKPEQVTAEIVQLLFESGAPDWSIEDKGVLLAAVKLQLSEKERQS